MVGFYDPLENSLAMNSSSILWIGMLGYVVFGD